MTHGQPISRDEAWTRVSTLVMNLVSTSNNRQVLLAAILDYSDAVDRDASERTRQIVAGVNA